MNGQEVAQDAHAAFDCPAAFRDHCEGRVAFADSGEHSRFNGIVHRLGQLISVDGVEKNVPEWAFDAALAWSRIPPIGESLGSLNPLLILGLLFTRQ
jgi:hypothetical protein